MSDTLNRQQADYSIETLAADLAEYDDKTIEEIKEFALDTIGIHPKRRPHYKKVLDVAFFVLSRHVKHPHRAKRNHA